MPGEPAPAPPRLLTSISLGAKGEHCILTLLPADKLGNLTLRRYEFHRLLAALVQTARDAHWEIAGLPLWLDRPATHLA